MTNTTSSETHKNFMREELKAIRRHELETHLKLDEIYKRDLQTQSKLAETPFKITELETQFKITELEYKFKMSNNYRLELELEILKIKNSPAFKNHTTA